MYSSYRSIVLIGAFLIFGFVTVSSQTAHQVASPRGTPQGNPPIQLSVTVTNKKGYVRGLSQENFQITIDKLPAKIVHFSSEDSPVSVGILLDASASMRTLATDKGKKLRILQEALSSFTALSNKAKTIS